MYVCKTLVAETSHTNTSEPYDYSHKENVFKIFLHLAANNFRQYRQINYYADRLCITNTYLSRIVREVSGKTVNYYLTQMVYDEACRLLTTTDKPLGEIAFDLNFKDQSAFSNFFKTKAMMTPSTFRSLRRKTQ